MQTNSKFELDKLTTDATAFRNFSQLQSAVKDHGYYPTLHVGNSAQLRLGQYLESIKVRVFWVGRVASHAA
jgi:hypothetical protein